MNQKMMFPCLLIPIKSNSIGSNQDHKKKMQKKSISKCSYYSLNALFHSLCQAGLLWQVTKVSIDFFSYEVMKDINIIMPEEVKKGKTVVFICISRSIIDMNQYRKIIETKDFKRRYNESELALQDKGT